MYSASILLNRNSLDHAHHLAMHRIGLILILYSKCLILLLAHQLMDMPICHSLRYISRKMVLCSRILNKCLSNLLRFNILRRLHSSHINCNRCTWKSNAGQRFLQHSHNKNVRPPWAQEQHLRSHNNSICPKRNIRSKCLHNRNINQNSHSGTPHHKHKCWNLSSACL